jgi:predicted SnoaL-like aldol condensation-catalyzing enzyme
VSTATKRWYWRRSIRCSTSGITLLHGRFWNVGQPANWIVADIVRIEDGLLAEHWDVIQDEATADESQSGLPMFGDTFPTPA